MKLETPVLALIIGSVLFTGLFTLSLNLADANDVTYDTSSYDTQGGVSVQTAFGKINDTKTDIETMQESFNDANVQDTGSVFPFLSLTFDIGKQIINSLTIFKDITYATAEIIGIPGYIVGALTSLLIIVVVISIIMVLLGRSY